jgi:thiamine biosynthesis lipoprotein ApbE
VRGAARALVATALLALPARAQELQRFEFKQIVMAIEARIVLYAPDEATAKVAASAAFAELDRLDGVFSDYREDSEVMRLCNGRLARLNPQQKVDPLFGKFDLPEYVVSDDLWTVLVVGEAMSRASAGAFDVAVGGTTRYWRGLRETGKPPNQADVDWSTRHGSSRQPGSSPRFQAMGERGHVQMDFFPIEIDLGGIAKGYAIGAALDLLPSHGIGCAMIEMGGDIVVGDAPPGELGWRISTAARDARKGSEITVVNAAVAASGDENQSLVVDETHYSHVIDPRSGWALTNRLKAELVMPFGAEALEPLAASVDEGVLPMYRQAIATSASIAALADALATAVTVLGPHEGRALANRAGAQHVRITDPAFTSLFDGTTLTGWTPRGGPYDGDAVWTVEDGCITGRTGPDDAGGLLYTATPHTSFEFQCEVQLDDPFDSGIFVRMAPEGRGLQLTLDDRPDGEIGGVYSDGWIQHAHPRAAAAWRRGEWNHVFVRCTGFDMRLEAWINGVLVMDRYVPQEFGADGRPAFAPRGLIGLQVHGGGSEGAGNAVRFRDLQVRDLPVFGDGWATDRALSPPEREARAAARADDGWRDLLAGADPLAAWEAVDGEAAPRAPADYTVQDGLLSIPSSPPAGYLRTREDFRDFYLRFDFRQARMSNSGLFLRGRRESTGPDGAPVPGGNPAYSGCEIQLLDDWNWEAVTNSQLEPWQLTGSLYGAVPPLPGLLGPIGEWNTLELLAVGSRLACALNGQTLWDVDTTHLAADPPFAQRAVEGFLGLQRYAAPDVAGPEALGVREMYVNSR